MQPFKILMMVLLLLGVIGGAILLSDTTTTFTGSTIVGIDPAQRTVRFQTREGETWILPVRDPRLLSSATVSLGDRVRIEVDRHHQVSTITKLPEHTRQHPLSTPLVVPYLTWGQVTHSVGHRKPDEFIPNPLHQKTAETFYPESRPSGPACSLKSEDLKKLDSL